MDLYKGEYFFCFHKRSKFCVNAIIKAKLMK